MAIRLELRFRDCMLYCLLFLLVPLRWIFAAVLAAGFHELCHYAAIRLCGVSVTGLTITGQGIQMHTGPLLPWQEFLCAAVGPLGSLSLLLLACQYPMLCVCGLVQGCYNLLPLLPLDGGRVVDVLLRVLFPAHSDRIGRWLHRIVLCALTCLGCLLAVRIGALLPFILVGMLILARLSQNCPFSFPLRS